MIDFRYHLVSIIAVFLALTVGLALGTTMLQDPLLNTLQSETADLRGQSEDLRAERDAADKVNAGADEMAEAVSGDMLADLLTGLNVVVVTTPGADEEMADALAGRVEEADAEVVGRVAITEAFLDGGNAAFVDDLSLQVTHDPDDLTGGPYEKAGAELGRALAGRADDSAGNGEDEGAAEVSGKEANEGGGGGGQGSREAETALEAFSEGGLITVEGDPAGASDAVVAVAPAAGSFEGGDLETANTVLATITAALHEEVGATVLAGDGPSARGYGMIALARADELAFATVDVAGRPMGEIITVLALAENLEKGGGAYGIGEEAQGFLPDPLPDVRQVFKEETFEVDPSQAESDTDEARRAARNGE